MAGPRDETSARIEVKVEGAPDHVRGLEPLRHGALAEVGGNVARDADIEAIVEEIGFHASAVQKSV
jgi:hypothetical protein